MARRKSKKSSLFTNNADVVNGSSRSDNFKAKAGDDLVNGLGGNDKLYGEAGNDTL